MDAAQQEATARARELQRNWYGEPLGALFRRLIDDLGLNQARLAGVLGLSAPMLSQLMSGQRAKIGNPRWSSAYNCCRTWRDRWRTAV